jgi:uncharacterized protein (DUF1330 family)
MSAYLIGHIKIKDTAQWAVYVEGVRKSLVPFAAQVVFRGKRAAVLTGEHAYEDTVVIKFPDQPTLQNWYHSESYQQLISTRDRAADVVIISFDA